MYIAEVAKGAKMKRNRVIFTGDAMIIPRRLLRVTVLSISAALLALPALAQTPGLAMLDTLELGQWQLIDRDNVFPTRSICLSNGRQLIQLRHDGAQCSQFVVADEARSVTVNYDCGRVGHGHTIIRHETNRLVQIETQGIVRGAPFSIAFEGRRVGSCN